MPRRPSNYPPTPGASTDITGKPSNVLQFDSSFALPPAALGTNRNSASSPASHNTDSSYRPLSPTSPRETVPNTPTLRKRPVKAQAVIIQDDYSLPPPPMRPRKIIQMDPQKTQQSKTSAASGKDAPATGANNKRKQAGTSTAQGRKIARRTAHSLIERRRRCKMNDEFAVLKEMIPGCKGQDMHKLSILQASIEYMRYLEKCVSDLKTVHRSRDDLPNPTSPEDQPHQAVCRFVPEDPGEEDNDDEDKDKDKDMEDADENTSSEPSPTIHPSDRAVHSNTTSPNIFAQGDEHPTQIAFSIHQQPDPRRFSVASSVPSNVTSPSIQALNQASNQVSPPAENPALSLAQGHYSFPTVTPRKGSLIDSAGPSSALTSPALGPQGYRDDHEATEALLMLNSDRRSWSDLGKRGMSVKDLLSG